MRFDEAAMLEGVSRWVSCESPSQDAAAVNRMIDLVTAELIDTPVGVERLPGRDGLGDTLALRAGPLTDAKPILILSHIDTVHPVGTLDRDLPMRVEGDRLYGPGVCDMKGGAYIAMTAVKHVARSKTAKRPIVMLFTPDEEIGSPTTRDLIEDVGRRCAYALVTEPARAGGRVVTARKGVGRFEVKITGRPSHAGARHDEGRSAIREAARQVLAIEALTDYARGITTTIGTIRGGTAPNVIPREAFFTVDLRIMNPEDADLYTQAILNLKPFDPDMQIEVCGGMNRPPYLKSSRIVSLLETAQAVAADLGQTLEDVPMTGGGADGNFTAALGVPTLDGLGIGGDGAHTLTEYGLISSLVPRAKLVAGLLETLD